MVTDIPLSTLQRLVNIFLSWLCNINTAMNDNHFVTCTYTRGIILGIKVTMQALFLQLP